jgi:hypothetical protein
VSGGPAGPARHDRELKAIRRDLPFLWIDARIAHATMKHRPDAAVEAASASPRDVVERVEHELAGEATRYRYAFYACIGVCLMPFLLSGLAWSALYWLPVTIFWFPFERGYYGLPWLSLYEWVAYLFLALFFVAGFALVVESHYATRRLSADYRRLADADEAGRRSFAAAVLRAGLARTELVLRSSAVFAEYVPALEEYGPDSAGAPLAGTASKEAGQ